MIYGVSVFALVSVLTNNAIWTLSIRIYIYVIRSVIIYDYSRLNKSIQFRDAEMNLYPLGVETDRPNDYTYVVFK